VLFKSARDLEQVAKKATKVSAESDVLPTNIGLESKVDLFCYFCLSPSRPQASHRANSESFKPQRSLAQGRYFALPSSFMLFLFALQQQLFSFNPSPCIVVLVLADAETIIHPFMPIKEALASAITASGVVSRAK
jgi:hypothetical protein